MWKFNVAAAAVMVAVSTATFAQTPAPADSNATSYAPAPPSPVTGPPPQAGGLPGGAVDPLISRTDTGLDKVANDGVSTKTVPAVPCGTAARETDGTTTCVGIPGPPGSIDLKSGTVNREK
jgi:hypothetical protein